MNRFFIFLCFFFLQYPILWAKNYVTIAPGSCPNCMAAIELMEKDSNIYVIPESYNIDSTALRNKYSFFQNAIILFSDSLFQLYSLNGSMSVSNQSGTLKCPLAQYGKTAHYYFTKWTNDTYSDTIIYHSYPVAKLSIKKRIFTPEGKLYLLNGVDNNVILFDLLEDKILDTISIPEIAKKKAYFEFGMEKGKNDYDYYKKLIMPKIQEPLCTIKDISFYKDTLYLYVSNYFAYWRGDRSEDTVLAHFQSISEFNYGKYLTTYVPTNIIEKLVDTSKKFYAEEGPVYKYGSNMYVTLWNSMFYTGRDKYLVGRFHPGNQKLDCVIKLSGMEGKSYNFSTPLFYNNYCMTAKSCKLYNLDSSGSFLDLAYFNQEYDNSGMFIPKYHNFDFRVEGNICTVLYNEHTNNKPYYAKINMKSNTKLINKYLPQLNPKLVRALSPFNSDYVIQYGDNYKIIKYKVTP